MTTKDMLLQYAKTNVATATPTPVTRVESPKTVADMLLNHASDVRTGRVPAVKLESVVPVKPQAVPQKTEDRIREDLVLQMISEPGANFEQLSALSDPAGYLRNKQAAAEAAYKSKYDPIISEPGLYGAQKQKLQGAADRITASVAEPSLYGIGTETITKAIQGNKKLPRTDYAKLAKSVQQDIEDLEQEVRRLNQQKIDLYRNPYAKEQINAINAKIDAATKRRAFLQKEYGNVITAYGADKTGFDAMHDSVMAGLNDANRNLFFTLDTYGKPFENVGSTGGAVQDALSALFPDIYKREQKETPILDYYEQQAEKWGQKAEETRQAVGGGWAEYGHLAESAAAMVPNMVLAMMTAGASAPASTLTAASNTLTSASAGLTGALKTAAQVSAGMMKNPVFWSSVSQTTGDSYYTAISEGATEEEALFTSVIVGLINAGVEVSGGIEALPAALRSGNTTATLAWVQSAMQEGGEEVVQGVIQQLGAKFIYDEDRKLASIEDPTAVFSFDRAAEEYLAGAALGGLMGGGQVLATNAINAARQNAATPQNPTPPTGGEAQMTSDITGAESGVQAQKNTASTEAGSVVVANTSLFNSGILKNLKQARKNLIAYAQQWFPKAVTVRSNGKTIGIPRNGLDKLLTGNLTYEKYASAFHVPELIENAVQTGVKGNYHTETLADIPTYEYYDSNITINEKPYVAHIRVKNTAMGDKYYGHTISEIEKIELEPTARASIANATEKSVNAQSDSNSTEIIPQTAENSNSDFLADVWGISQNAGAQQEQALDENGNPLPSGVGAMSSSYAVETGRSKVGSNTFANSSIFSEAEKELLGTNEMSYYVLSEQESMERAADRLALDFNGEMEDLQAWNAWSGEDLDTAMGILSELTRKARESGDYTEVRKWTKLIQDRGTTGGQFVQAFAKYSRTPEGIMVRATDAMENTKLSEEQKNEILHNVEVEAAKLHDLQDGDKQAAIDLILETSRIRKTGSLFKNAVSKMLQKALAADSFDHLKQVATAGVESIAEDYIPQTTADKVYSIRKLFMLSNLATVVRNFVGNNVFDPIDAFAGSTAMVPLDILLSKITGTRSIAVDKSWLSAAKRKGAMEGVLKSYIEVALDVNPRGLESRYESNSTRSFKMTGNLIERFLSTMAKYQGYTLLTTDEFQKGGIAAETQRGLDALKAKGVIADESLDTQAQEMAKYRTFQKDSTTAKAVAKIKSGADSIGNDWIRIGDLTVPFAKVPANLAEIAAVDYSPTGAVRGVAELVNVLRAAKAGTLTASQQAKALNDIGRGLTGTGLITFFTLAALSGILRVAGSDDEDEKALETAEGITGTQMNISALSRFLKGESTAWQDGDELFSIQFLEPINAQMTTGAMLAEEIKDGEFSAGDILGKTFAGSWEALLQLPVMESIQTFFNNLRYSKADSEGERFADAAASYLASQASSFVIPNAVRAIAKGTDPIVRDVRARSNTGDTIKDIWFDTIDSFKSGVPGLRQTIQPSLDNYGRERTYGDNPFANFLNATVFPGSVTEYRTNALEEEQKRLTTATGKSVIPNKEAPASISNAGTKYTLSLDEQDAFQKLYGDTIESVGNLIMEDPAFSVFSDTQKSEIMADINAYALDVAKRSLVEQQGGEYKSSDWSGKDTFTAEEFATYLMYRQAIGDMKASKGADDDAFQQLADMYESLTAEEKDIVDDMDGFEKAYAAAQSGMDMQNYYGLKDAYSAVKSSKGADAQAFIDLMPFYDTLNAEQKEIFNPENDKTIGKLATAYKAGIEPQKYYEVKATLATITGNTQQADKLNSMSGLTPSQKKVLENLLISDYRMISSEVNYDYSSQSAYGFSKLSESAQKVYNAELTGSGISKSDYTKVVNFKNGADSTDEDGDGKADTFSIGKQVLDYIDGLSLTDAQKQALAVSMGYSEKNIDKYAPWN